MYWLAKEETTSYQVQFFATACSILYPVILLMHIPETLQNLLIFTVEPKIILIDLEAICKKKHINIHKLINIHKCIN